MSVLNCHVVIVTGDGKLWYIIRSANGSWQACFDDVKAQTSNDPGPFMGSSCTAADGDLHVVGTTSDGKLWYTIRSANGSWQPFFDDIKAQEANDPGPLLAVDVASALTKVS